MTIKNGDLPAMPIFLTDAMTEAAENNHGDAVDKICGLTKREMFAMAAMQGLLASLTADDSFSPRELAKSAVLNADSLLAELERTK